MPPECIELCARRLEIKKKALGFSGWLAGSLARWLSLALLLGDVWVIVLQLPAFPNGWCFGWEETLGTA